MEANIKGEYPIKNSTIVLFVVMVGLILGVGIDIIFYSSPDEVQTVETYELPKEEPKKELLIEF